MEGSKECSGNVIRYDDLHTLSQEGIPNSRADLYIKGRLKQSRWYDSSGKAIRNKDYFHGGSKHTFPHEHMWDWSKNPPRQITIESLKN